jgi:hypothetical protein
METYVVRVAVQVIYYKKKREANGREASLKQRRGELFKTRERHRWDFTRK